MAEERKLLAGTNATRGQGQAVVPAHLAAAGSQANAGEDPLNGQQRVQQSLHCRVRTVSP
jgi:hypothetical protein